MLRHAKRKQVSLFLAIVMILSSVFSLITPSMSYAEESTTKEEITKLEFAATADPSKGITSFPDTVPYSFNALGASVDSNATYKPNTSVGATTLLATGWGVDKYWEFGFSPVGYENLTISFMPRSSGTGPKDFKVQYSTDKTTWIDVVGATYQVTNDYNVVKTFDLPSDLSNVNSLYIRMVVTSNISVRAGTSDKYPADEQIQTGGVSNIGSIVLSGTSVTGSDGVTITPVTSNYPTDSIVPADQPIELSTTVVSGSAIVSGAAIMYSVDGGNYNAYTVPFNLEQYGANDTKTEFTIHAYAEYNGKKSVSSTFHYLTKEVQATESPKPSTTPSPGAVKDPIADDLVASSGAKTIKEIYDMQTGTATVIGQVAYQYPNSIIIQDVIDGQIIGLQLFDKTNTYTVGDIITTTGTISNYKGVTQISPTVAPTTVSTATPFAPQVLTVAELLAGGDAYLSEYIQIKNATLGAVNSSNRAITDDTGSINLYQGAALPEGIKDGDKINLSAAFSKYSTTYQLRNGASTDYQPITSSGDDSTVDTSVVLPMASFAGTGKIDSTTVYADKNSPNDYLNTAVWLTYSKNGVLTIPQITTSGTSTSYFLGSKGSSEGDYYQIDLSSKLYGNINLSYAMKGSATSAKNWKILYSTDGATWSQATSSNLSIVAEKTTQTFSVTLPVNANNADQLQVRIQVSDAISIGNAAISTGGTNYLSDIKITGSPIVSEKIVGCPDLTPDAGEVRLGDEITMTTATEGATICYTVNGGAEKVYDPEHKPTFTELPATITVYAKKAGLNDSLFVTYGYTQEKVLPVKATPNGGAKVKGTKVKLTCATEGAKIEYSVDGGTTWKDYNEANQITLDEFPVKIIAKATLAGCKDSEMSEFNYTQRLNEKYSIYFGQIHSHTSYSDGAGTCDDAFNYAKNTAKQIDFLAVTDHSNSFDNADKATLSDGSVSSEWKEGHELADKYTDDTFVGIYGFEMTWSNGLGHMNTLNSPGFQSRTQAEFSTYSTALNNYYKTLKTETESISQFNHPGTTFGDFSDFDHYDAEIDNLISLIEVGNGEGAIGSSGYFPSYEYYTRALDKGWHVAPTNNQDNHKGYWGDSNTARTVVLADSLTRDNIYDALRNMRTYATEDNDLEIQYTLNGEIMGTVMDSTPDSAEIQVSLKDPTDSAIGKVEVIVNGGLSIANETVKDNEATVKFTLPADYSYYYIRVTQPDSNIAVTAPVWVSEVESVGISGMSTSAVLPVKGEALDIKTDFYNNEAEDLKVNSIEYTVNDNVIHKVDLEKSGLASVASCSKNTYSFDYTYEDAGNVNVYVTVHATLGGVEKVYNNVLKLNYVDPSMVTHVVVDGTHYNDYVTGYYGGNMGNFSNIAADDNIKVDVIKDKITADILSDCDLLIISAPAKKNGTANAGAYTISHFEDEFINLVKDYTDKGGTVIVCGIADYQDSIDSQTSTELNKLLSAIGATTRVNNDEAVDDTNNGGQKYRLYLTNSNTDSIFTKGIVEGQKYSAYSGCTVQLDDNAVKAGIAQYLVKGHDTTYSINSKMIGEEPVAVNGTVVKPGDTVMLAREQLASGSNVFVASTVFMSDFEVKAELDNANDLAYMNKTIIENILESIRKEVAVTSIADARLGKKGDIFCVEGTVTAGTVSGNAFFDTIYIQDETGGINIFPINEGVIEVGQKVKVVGYLDEYLGDKELRVISATVTDTAKNPIAPTNMSTKDAMNYETNGGKLVNVKGTITDVVQKNGIVETIMLKDDSGIAARVFIDGYVLYSDANSKKLEEIAVIGNKISAVGLVSFDPEGVRLRVRDRSEITLSGTVTPTPATPSPTNNNSSTTVKVDNATNTKVTTTVTKSTDTSGNTVVSTVETSTNATTGDLIGTVTKIVTEDKDTGSVVNVEIVSNRDNEVTKAVATVKIKAETVNSNGITTIKSDVVAEALMAAASKVTTKVPLSVTVQTPTDSIVNALNDKAVTNVDVAIQLPTSVLNNSKIEISDIIIDKSVMSTAKKQKKDIQVLVSNETGKEIYSITFDGDTLKTSKKDVTAINASLDISLVKEVDNIYEFIRSYLPESTKDQGLVFDFKHSGILPDTAKVRVYVGDKEGMNPGSTLYVYYYNESAKSGTNLKNNKRLEEGSKVKVVIDANGYVEINIKHCSSYILLPQQPDNAIVSSIFEQIIVPSSKTLYVKNAFKVTPALPLEAEDAIVTYKTSNKSVATVNQSGKVTAKKAGKVTITTTITVNGVSKNYKTTITVKKPYIKLNVKDSSLKVGETLKLTAKAYGVSGDITYSSSNKKIAVINGNGKITAKKVGTVTITVSVEGVVTKIKIKVKKK